MRMYGTVSNMLVCITIYGVCVYASKTKTDRTNDKLGICDGARSLTFQCARTPWGHANPKA